MDSGRGTGAVVVAALVVAFAASQGADLGLAGGGSPGCVREVRQHAGFEPAQLKHAATIAQVGVDEGVGRRGVVVGLATAMQESGLRNLDYGDRDSLGLFQQREWWGSAKQRQTPTYAARKFFRTLKKVDGWRRMSVTQAAQKVQVSAFPNAYAKHERKARRLAGALLRDC